MTVVNTETGEVITYADVRDSIKVARESGSKFFEQIVWQIEHQTWTLLGYSSWDEMRETEYAGMGVVVPSADRPEITARLRRTGMTHRQIATTVGVSESTVRGDLNRKSADEPLTTVTNARGQERPATYQRATPTPSPTIPQGEPVSRAVGEGTTPQGGGAQSADASAADYQGSAKPRPADSSPLQQFIDADARLAQTSWNKEFMAAIAKAGRIAALFTPADVAEKADPDLIDELDRLVADLTNYAARVKAQRPHRLTAIRGGAQ